MFSDITATKHVLSFFSTTMHFLTPWFKTLKPFSLSQSAQFLLV